MIRGNYYKNSGYLFFIEELFLKKLLTNIANFKKSNYKFIFLEFPILSRLL